MLKVFNRIKSIKPNFNFGKVLFVFTLSFVMIIQIFITQVSAAPSIKTMVVEIGEGGVDQSNLSKTINISNLENIVSVSSNTGNVSYTLNGEIINLNASGGTPSRSVNNTTKYSKIATDYRTNTTNSFSSTINFSDSQGYAGQLSKNGGSTVISGTPSDSKTVTEEIPLSNSASINYDKDGYRGTLIQINKKYIDPLYWITVFSGTVTRPDTRKWQQDYRGTIYKSGYDNYYKYTVTIEYTDNKEPILTLMIPNENSYFSKNLVA